jgi:hypothetical protein
LDPRDSKSGGQDRVPVVEPLADLVVEIFATRAVGLDKLDHRSSIKHRSSPRPRIVASTITSSPTTESCTPLADTIEY